MKALKESDLLLKRKFKLKSILFGFVTLLAVSLFLFYLLKLVEPSITPLNVIVSNVSDHQVAISWVTTKPTKGEIVVSSDGKFPLLPVFASQVYRDDGEKSLKTTGLYLTHHITVGKLKPNKVYYFRIYQGLKRKYEGRFRTGSALTKLNPPNPVYGKIVKKDKKTPVVGALVYLWVSTEASNSAFLSTLTNNEGRWSMDLSNIRTTDFKSSFKLQRNSEEGMIIDSGAVRVKAQTVLGKDKPWPNLGI